VTKIFSFSVQRTSRLRLRPPGGRVYRKDGGNFVNAYDARAAPSLLPYLPLFWHCRILFFHTKKLQVNYSNFGLKKMYYVEKLFNGFHHTGHKQRTAEVQTLAPRQ
jgi:hypothetical protein